MNREVWHAIRRGGGADMFLKKVRVANVHHAINERAGYRNVLDKYVEDGKIGVIRSGMDCDCSQYYSERIITAPIGAIQFAREDAAHYESLDGPESTSWQKPSLITPQHKSADRALEAYEDGRPNLILWGSL